MLDINKLYSQIESLGSHQQSRNNTLKAALEAAGQQLEIASNETDKLQRRIDKSNTSWLVAMLTYENPAAVRNAPTCPESYTILSTDGSQIEPSRHNSHPAYLINVGGVSIGYNDYHGYEFTSEPSLYFKDDEIIRLFGGEERPAAGTVLAALRQKMEAESLSKMIQGCKHKPAVALVDGTLILWTLEQRADRLKGLSQSDLKLQSFQTFMSLLNAGKNAGVPVAGYISSPAGSDVVNMLRVSICPNEQVNCNACHFKNPNFEGDPPCAKMNGITDAGLFGGLLAAGQRSSLFESRSEILDAYKNKNLNLYDEESVFFFYLNTGKEIARIEIPRWIVGDAADIGRASALDLTHAVCLDQADKGKGYPIAVAEAHEQAVVKGPDRELFHQLVERELVQQGTPIRESMKAFRKKGGLI